MTAADRLIMVAAGRASGDCHGRSAEPEKGELMPNTPEHKSAMYAMSQGLRAAGKPTWGEEIDVSDIWRSDALRFEQKRDIFVQRLRASAWVNSLDESHRVHELVGTLAIADDVREFDGWLDELYDEADYARVWIKTF